MLPLRIEILRFRANFPNFPSKTEPFRFSQKSVSKYPLILPGRQGRLYDRTITWGEDRAAVETSSLKVAIRDKEKIVYGNSVYQQKVGHRSYRGRSTGAH